jgi:anti-sigma B factor antagonist
VTPSPILVGQVGDLFWIRVDGRGCFQNSRDVKTVIEQTAAQRGLRTFVIDLDRCPMMDSTFMGTLTGAALFLKESVGGCVAVVNANDRNRQLLENLGLDHILKLDGANEDYAKERACVASVLATSEMEECASKTAQAEHVLAAHNALCQASERNALRFQDVIQFLERDLSLKTAAVA